MTSIQSFEILLCLMGLNYLVYSKEESSFSAVRRFNLKNASLHQEISSTNSSTNYSCGCYWANKGICVAVNGTLECRCFSGYGKYLVVIQGYSPYWDCKECKCGLSTSNLPFNCTFTWNSTIEDNTKTCQCSKGYEDSNGECKSNSTDTRFDYNSTTDFTSTATQTATPSNETRNVTWTTPRPYNYTTRILPSTTLDSRNTTYNTTTTTTDFTSAANQTTASSNQTSTVTASPKPCPNEEAKSLHLKYQLLDVEVGPLSNKPKNKTNPSKGLLGTLLSKIKDMNEE